MSGSLGGGSFMKLFHKIDILKDGFPYPSYNFAPGDKSWVVMFQAA